MLGACVVVTPESTGLSTSATPSESQSRIPAISARLGAVVNTSRRAVSGTSGRHFLRVLVTCQSLDSWRGRSSLPFALAMVFLSMPQRRAFCSPMHRIARTRTRHNQASLARQLQTSSHPKWLQSQ